MKLFTSLALAAAGVSATTVEDKCLICSHVGFASSEDNAIAGKRFKMVITNVVLKNKKLSDVGTTIEILLSLEYQYWRILYDINPRRLNCSE